jgi:hypothetical protein
MRLRGRHLVHGLVLFEQLGVQCAAEVCWVDALALAEVVAGEEAVEVRVAVVGNVQMVGRKGVVAALGPELGRVAATASWWW